MAKKTGHVFFMLLSMKGIITIGYCCQGLCQSFCTFNKL